MESDSTAIECPVPLAINQKAQSTPIGDGLFGNGFDDPLLNFCSMPIRLVLKTNSNQINNSFSRLEWNYRSKYNNGRIFG